MNLQMAVLVFVGALSTSAHADSVVEISAKLMNATVRITVGKATGTGFIVQTASQTVLVTAAHVLEESTGPKAFLTLRIKKSGKLVPYNFEITIRAGEKALWSTHDSTDVAAIPLKFPQGVHILAIPLDLLATEQQLLQLGTGPGAEVLILGYPFGAASSKAGFPFLRSGRIASYPFLPTAEYPTFLVDFEIFPGNSGGPVVIVQPNPTIGKQIMLGKTMVKVLGLVSQEKTVTETVRSLKEETKKTHALSIAVVVHSQFIRELLARRLIKQR